MLCVCMCNACLTQIMSVYVVAIAEKNINRFNCADVFSMSGFWLLLATSTAVNQSVVSQRQIVL